MLCNSPRIGAQASGVELADVEQDGLEHAAAEQAEPRQRLARGGAEVASREFERGEQRRVAAFPSRRERRRVLLEAGQELGEVGANRLGRKRLQMRADEFQRQRMIGEVVEQRIEPARG
jgi:hypothetical protein